MTDHALILTHESIETIPFISVLSLNHPAIVTYHYSNFMIGQDHKSKILIWKPQFLYLLS
jgi:hypothetical protein